MRHRHLAQVLEHIEHLVRAGFKDISFITPDSLAYLSDDGVYPHYARFEQALIAMHEVAGKAKIKFGEFPSKMRPEFITLELSQLIDRYSDAAYLVIGAQSGSEAMLQAMHREHDVAAVERAVRSGEIGKSKKRSPIASLRFGENCVVKRSADKEVVSDGKTDSHHDSHPKQV